MIEKEQFIAQYCKNSNMTEESFREYFVALPCACGQSDCQGWAAVVNIEELVNNHNELYAPKEKKDG